MYSNIGGRRPAEVGDLLMATGDGVQTEVNASTTLEVDTGVGTIALQENTEIAIQSLDFADDGGYITRLYVSQGGVSLNLRRFTHPSSELEIETPSGVTGVRGTEFGVLVHPSDSRTGVATQSGEVYAEAESVEVSVPEGFQTLIRPGEPPLPPKPIPEEPFFNYQIEIVVRDGLRYLRIVGQIDPINQVYVEDELQQLNELGEFTYEVPAFYGANIDVRIVTPLGDETVYDIPLL
ncbi:FecR domain-containing protein [Oscillatoria sp. CS-180]|uniref:FecR family protein n=1 Tax=Oscillatoria sp. CS-180 TaxID=3021720 RepID=UPI0023300DE7|nr:FecR domain-containing protein [Oscillatoria sp. CS-180]MDB9524709.1 FecR domain-containing protein [Oscillatoria sp. CS-180]